MISVEERFLLIIRILNEDQIEMQEVRMQEIVFDSRLLKDGHLYCPKRYANPGAKFKVIVSLPDEDATDSEIEMAAVVDHSDDFLSKEELDYYLSLDEK
ncbi:MAG: hypothetical protein JSV88_24890 [Candidatus Aminicenantes bacterium]|nr:MAG: hypothetical protein JSV88_24890 [Candidatus Aminicenantes bacterium]